MASFCPAEEASFASNMNSSPLLLLDRLPYPHRSDAPGHRRPRASSRARLGRPRTAHAPPALAALRPVRQRLREGPRAARARRPRGLLRRGPAARSTASRSRLGGTPFQREVWAALRRIPAGDTMSYGALAARIERRSAVRAVGTRERGEPDRDRRALPSGHRGRHLADGLRRRPGAKALAASPRRRRPSGRPDDAMDPGPCRS